MPEIPDVSAIAQQVKSRIKQIEEQLRQRDKLTDELARLRDALSRLEGEARSRVRSGDRRGRSTPSPDTGATATRAAKPATGSPRAPRGQNKAKVLEALKDGPMTAYAIANATGIATGTVSTMLTKMAKSGELTKAARGYTLPR